MRAFDLRDQLIAAYGSALVRGRNRGLFQEDRLDLRSLVLSDPTPGRSWRTVATMVDSAEVAPGGRSRQEFNGSMQEVAREELSLGWGETETAHWGDSPWRPPSGGRSVSDSVPNSMV